MQAVGRQVHLLPPLPRFRDWLASGATAGLLLGLAGVLAAGAEGIPLPPSLSLLLFASHALLVAALTAPVFALLRALGRRPSHSLMVGAVLAPLGLCALASPLWQRLAAEAPAPPGTGLRVAAGAAIAVGVALLAARLGERAERSGTPACGVAVWGGFCALLVAGLRVTPQAAAAGLPSPAARLALGLGAAVLALALWLGWLLVRRWGSRPRRPPTQVLAWTLLLSVGVALAPSAAPWILYDESLPALGDDGPPNLLLVAFATPDGSSATRVASPGVASSPPTIELLGWQGLRYQLPDDAAGAAASLRLPGGGSLVSRLQRAGYATAAIHLDPSFADDLGAGEVDARPVPNRQLHASLAWLPATPLLLGPGAPLLSALGLDAERHTPQQVARRAERWLVHWRTRRAPNPFALIVDLRGADGGLEAADAALASILENLVQLEVEGDTLVLLSFEPLPTRGGARARTTLVLRPPLRWRAPSRPAGPRRALALETGELGAALLELSRSDGRTPGALPGLEVLPPASDASRSASG